MENNTDYKTDSIITLAFLTEACIIVAVNSVALAVFLSEKFLVKKSTYLLVNLTVADLMVGLTLGFQSVYELADFQYDLLICNFVNYTPLYGSAFLFMGIAIERAYAILVPLKHLLLGNKVYFIGISFIWIGAVVTNVDKIFEAVNARTQIHKQIQVTTRVILGGVSLLVMFLCYLAIWIKVKFTKPLPNQGQVTNNNTIKLTITFFCVTIISIVCFVPSQIVLVSMQYFDVNRARIEYQIALIMVYANSFANFVIYTVRMPEFRKGLCKVIKMCQPTCRLSAAQENYATTSESIGQPTLIVMNNVSLAEGEIPSYLQHAENKEKHEQIGDALSRNR
ncbi:predicted protein [Nematostella vectensis]|uniref:G-protein coupled receptors family 1 profile domain-containing protein n=1 Tax=Nematostella vectensis TaxID=45351 RepID=A7RV10_NEMVE|nr:predicted protein [Nematostella vectensis]|eukprot:XP_001636727.1 predicted protein [Nematostella vectensis]